MKIGLIFRQYGLKLIVNVIENKGELEYAG